MNKNVNYGNWVPEKILTLCYVGAGVFAIAAGVTGLALHLTVPTWILGILAAICLIYGIYMHACHELFAFGKGNMMANVHQHLDFPDETFDAAVSNFVFHEVRSAKNKRDVVKEALRVVKKGGAFSFQDMFSQKSLYGDMEEFVEELKKEGITEIHYIGNLEKKLDFIPGYATTPWMISGMGILYGRK